MTDTELVHLDIDGGIAYDHARFAAQSQRAVRATGRPS